MLKKLEIKNFQSHKNSTLEFRPGLNVIIGSSNCGKTVILRALNWIISNRPRGQNFIRHGTTDCQVTLETDNTTIVRTRNKKENCYTINGEILTALSGNVPPQITDTLNLSDLNIQNQLDQHFLTQDSPGKVAQAINNVTHLENAEEASSKISNKINALARKIEIDKQTEKEYREKLKRFEYLGDFEHTLVYAKTITKNLEKTNQQIDGIEKIESSFNTVQTELQALPTPLEGLDELLEKVVDTYNQNYSTVDSLSKLSTIVNNFVLLQKQLDSLPAKIDIKKLDNLEKETTEIGNRLYDLRELVMQFHDFEEDMFVQVDELKILKKELGVVTEDLEICPLCGQELQHIDVDSFMEMLT